MKDLRFTGNINGDYIDIRLRTDMISQGDENFNITQIQEGESFDTNDKKSKVFQKYFSADFNETNNSLGHAKQFAIDNGLDLRIYNGDGTYEGYLINDSSVSASAS